MTHSTLPQKMLSTYLLIKKKIKPSSEQIHKPKETFTFNTCRDLAGPPLLFNAKIFSNSGAQKMTN